MKIEDLRVGDRLIWHRAGQTDEAEVLEIDLKIGKAKLKIEGWLGTNWETITSSFERKEVRP